MLLEEVTNIRTTYLRAGLIDEPICSGTKKLLVDYVDQRVELTRDFSKLSKVMPDPSRFLTRFGIMLNYWQSGTGVQKFIHSILHP